jgi:hypothetical protein
VLTSEGITAKERMMAQLAAKMPWCYALDDGERRCLLFLLRKMLDAPSPGTTDDAGAGDQSTTDHHNQSVPGPHGEVRGADDM